MKSRLTEKPPQRTAEYRQSLLCVCEFACCCVYVHRSVYVSLSIFHFSLPFSESERVCDSIIRDDGVMSNRLSVSRFDTNF